MPLVFPNEGPDYHYMIVELRSNHTNDDRQLVIFISGKCSFEECHSFIIDFSTLAKRAATHPNHVPRREQYFEHADEVNVETFAFNFRDPNPNETKILKIMKYYTESSEETEILTNIFAIGLQNFTDPYTFHVSKHSLKSYSWRLNGNGAE